MMIDGPRTNLQIEKMAAGAIGMLALEGRVLFLVMS